MAQNKSYYRPDIEGLRGLAVCMVVFYHLFPEFFPNGFLGVDIFFVISGYVVTQALERNLNKGLVAGLITFYSSRAKRILPALFVMLTVTALMCALFIPPTELSSILKTGGAAALGLSNVALSYARFDYFNLSLALNPFLHTWSLGVEQQYYLLFPALFLATKFFPKNRLTNLTFLLLITFLSFGLWLYLSQTSPIQSFYNPLGRFWEFLCGCLMHLTRNSVSRKITSNQVNGLQFLAFLMFVAANIVSVSDYVVAPIANILAVFSTIILIRLNGNGVGFLDFIKSSPMVWVGRLSYSLYLWHIPVFSVARWNLEINNVITVLFLLVILSAVSWISYRSIELRFRYITVNDLKVLVASFFGAVSVFTVMASFYLASTTQIYLGNSSAYGDLWPPSNVPLTMSLRGTQRYCHLEYGDEWSPKLLKTCQTGPTQKEFVYLVGNSLAQHLIPMLDVASSKIGIGYSALTVSNCRMISALQVMPLVNYRFDLCKQYFDEMITYIRKNAEKGDIILFGDRSFFDKPTIDEGAIPSNVYIGDKRLSNLEAYEKTMQEIALFMDEMVRRGVSIILAAPTPVFERAPTQCVEEWFRVDRNGCSVPLGTVSKRRKKYIDSLSDLGELLSLVYILDPLPSICDDQVCRVSRNNKLMFRDKLHLSSFGSYLLADSFVETLIAIRAKP